MLLLELAEDSNELLYAFLLWSLAVGCLAWLHRRVARRDRQRIDAAAVGQVRLVRERVHSARQGAEAAAAAAAAAAVDSDGGARGADAGAQAGQQAPREREDCPICLDSVSWPVETNCAHEFCAQCFLSYYDQASGVVPSMVRCPCCRRNCDVILPRDWSAAESRSDEGADLRAKLDDYNARFGAGRQRGVGAIVRDTPTYLSRLWRSLSAMDEGTWSLLRQARLWIFLLTALTYLWSPLDLLPEALFGLVGLLDDLLFVGLMLVMVGAVVRSAHMEQVRAEQ